MGTRWMERREGYHFRRQIGLEAEVRSYPTILTFL